MQLILLSGGSGKRLWPLSNDAYSKQFLRLLPSPDGIRESMLQRVIRQIHEAGLDAAVTIATGENQRDPIICQLGEAVDIVTEPERRDTFPAIALACKYLEKEKSCNRDETVVVMPSDPYTDTGYFQSIRKMADELEQNKADLVLMGIQPTYASTKYGYIIPENAEGSLLKVSRFTEKPDEKRAEELKNAGALWNGGVFVFRLGYLLDIINNYIHADSFAEFRSRYAELPKISFDYEVVEKANNIGVVPFVGLWKDLGTWDALTEVLDSSSIGNCIMDKTSCNTNMVNQLDIPCICVGTSNLVVAAGPDGILVADKGSCEHIKEYVAALHNRPMYEERRWGTYEIINNFTSKSGTQFLIKHICVHNGKSVGYQKHSCRDEIWTIMDGTGCFVLDGETKMLQAGDTVYIRKGQKHAIKAVTELDFIEQQIGNNLTDDDVEYFDWHWS